MEREGASVRNSIRDHIVSRWLNGDGRGLDDETDLQRIGVLDSFSTLDVVAFLGEAFQVEIEPADINGETFRAISTITDLVLGKLAAADPQRHSRPLGGERG